MLYKHQIEGAEWLAARARGYLADPPGLGKTRTILKALQLAEAERPLIVCPAIVRTFWWREAEAMGLDVSVTSYEGAQKVGGVIGYDAIVMDEAHYARNDVKRTKALLGRTGLALRSSVKRVYFASGTPIVKSPADLWIPLSVCWPELLRAIGVTTKGQYLEHFCELKYSVYSKKMEPRPGVAKNAEQLKAIMQQMMLLRGYDDAGLDLPALLWSEMAVDGASLTGGPMTLEDVDALEHEAKSTWRRLVGEAKAKAAAELIIGEVETDDAAEVVFAYHRGVLQTMQNALGVAKVRTSYVDGDTPPAKRQAEIDKFQRGETKVFLGQQTACETGITLTRSRRVTLVEPSWTAVNNVQAGRRVCRIGQTAQHCQVRMLALAGSLDEAVVRRHHLESRMFDDVMDWKELEPIK